METGYFNRETAKELRIGNIVKYYYNDEWFELQYDDFRSIFSIDSEAYDRVPLTEEWLLKFGFESQNGVFYKELYDNDHFIKGYMVKDYFSHAIIEYDSIGDRESVSLINIKYVHQLQNLYFDLTGNYLTIHE